ncbi:MAG: PSD1 and planctomycete cytochrome C domain-containing protein [Isosphaeraceae bacterium]|nr:PSD1 and planctomycete cytochrome C domain-containing protein [Isosphaeraceae bacterium]
MRMETRTNRRLTVACAAFVAVLHGGALRGDDGNLFTAQVRPILARHCFKCHGPDDKARKGKLRLDTREAATQPADSGTAAVVPGKADESELVARIFAEDESERMPPPNTKDQLNDEERRVLKRWVTEGAEYRAHWAFVSPRQAPLPRVRQHSWPRNAVDSFILSRLEAAELRPAPQADRATLIRRVTLDLVGLPPTPAEVDAFLADSAPDAFERLVDRLLASPRYGERWARKWLDLARYADTNGYEKDRPRSVWPYRDWVIRALNADMPFDRFTIEQIAGDMLPGASFDQRIATGFHRNTMLNEEGGIDPLEYRFHAMTDRVATTGTVWLGLTIGCAQCHTHKYDPISQREYYQLMAFLNNADEPELSVPTPSIDQQRRALEAQIETMVANLPAQFPVDSDPKDPRSADVRRRERLDRKFQEWLEQESARTVRWRSIKPVDARASLPLLTVEADGSVFASGDQSKSDTYDLTFREDLRGVTAIRLEVLPDDRLPRHGPGRIYYEGPFGDFFLSEVRLTAGGKAVPFSNATASVANGKNDAKAAIDGDPQSGWSIDGGQGRAHTAVFTLAAPLGETRELSLRLLFERYYAAGLGRFRIAVTTDPRPAIARDMPGDVEALFLVPSAERSAEDHARLFKQFLLAVPELAKAREAIDAVRKQMPADPTTLVMSERPPANPRPTFRHNRGEYLQPTERVEPDVLSMLPRLPDGARRGRLEFARWLVSPTNPLVARVTMNRQWAVFFGRGIVATPQDFGYQGEAPSHPELLDWLAVELVNQRWSLKAIHRLIVTSATYQQSSRVTPELLARDAENRLLARAPRVRLEAETIRDQALRASGLLFEKVGGPSVYPPQPAGVTTDGTYGGLEWKLSPGGDRYRRGLYTFSKRTAPYAMFTTFDGPSGEVCVARRDVSNTPLQALTLLNDPVFTEAAQAFGRLLGAQSGTVEERIDHLFRRCLSRPPSAEERAALVRYFESQKARFVRHELDAQAVAGAGEGDVMDRAAWTVLARAILNLDETITRG